MNHILGLEEGKSRFLKAVTELCQAFALAVPHEKALAIRDRIAFFQAVRGAMTTYTVVDHRAEEDLDSAIRQIISKAISSDKIIDIFSAAGLKRPEIAILSDEFLDEVRGMEHKNLALELLRKLLNDEIKTRSRTQLVQSKRFSEMLQATILKYQNRVIEAAKVIEEMISQAKDMREADKRGEYLDLNDAELAFYEALEVNDSAVKVLGDSVLRSIAQELVESVRKNASIDWAVKENVRAKMRVHIRRILKKHGYPPDIQEKATQTVLEQAALMANHLTA